MIIKKPIITEKSMKLADKNLYTFLVDKTSTKDMIARKVAEKFKVEVIKVKTINIKPKKKIQRKVRGFYQIPGFKKAVVEVKKGQKIAIFETPKEEVSSLAEGEPIIMKEKKDLFGRTKVKVEKSQQNVGALPTTQRKVITGK